MAGGAAGTPNQMGSASPAAPSQASQYSNYGAQPNGAFYAGPMSGAPASGGSYAQPSMPTYQSQPMQSYQPQFGGGYGQGYGLTGGSGAPAPQYAQQPQYQPQGYGSPFGGMDDGFRSPFAPPVQSSPFGGMGGMYGPQPQYGYGGMGNQFMGGGMGGFDPYGGRPARSFGGRDMYGPYGGRPARDFGPYGGRPARDFGPQMTQMASPGIFGLQRAMRGGYGGFDPRSGFNTPEWQAQPQQSQVDFAKLLNTPPPIAYGEKNAAGKIRGVDWDY